MSSTTPHRCARAVQVSLTHMLVDCSDSTHRSGWTWRVSWIRATWSCSPPGVWSSGSSSRTRSGPWGGLPPAGGTGGPCRPPSLWERRSREDKSHRLTHWASNLPLLSCLIPDLRSAERHTPRRQPRQAPFHTEVQMCDHGWSCGHSSATTHRSAYRGSLRSSVWLSGFWHSGVFPEICWAVVVFAGMTWCAEVRKHYQTVFARRRDLPVCREGVYQPNSKFTFHHRQELLRLSADSQARTPATTTSKCGHTSTRRGGSNPRRVLLVYWSRFPVCFRETSWHFLNSSAISKTPC